MSHSGESRSEGGQSGTGGTFPGQSGTGGTFPDFGVIVTRDRPVSHLRCRAFRGLGGTIGDNRGQDNNRDNRGQSGDNRGQAEHFLILGSS
jgi:hypothetical protein